VGALPQIQALFFFSGFDNSRLFGDDFLDLRFGLLSHNHDIGGRLGFIVGDDDAIAHLFALAGNDDRFGSAAAFVIVPHQKPDNAYRKQDRAENESEQHIAAATAATVFFNDRCH
jgi:hypothetical protein